MAEKKIDVIEPKFDGALIDEKYIKGGMFKVKTRAQRNAIGFDYRKLDGGTTTLVFVSADNAIYELLTNPATDATTDEDWKRLDFGVSDILIVQGTWDKDNTDPVLQDTDAIGNGNDFYVVTDAATPTVVQYPGLFGGQSVTVVNGDWIISDGTEWFVSPAPINWDSIAGKPTVIDDYVAGTVIVHSHIIGDVTGLDAALALKYDLSNVADNTIDPLTVPDDKIVSVLFLKTNFYFKNETYSQTEVDNAIAVVNPTTTKGDFYTHNGTIPVRKPIGGDGEVPIADSGEAHGWAWGTIPAATPAGSNGAVQYNNSGAAGGFGNYDGSVFTLSKDDASTNTIINLLKHSRTTSGTAGDGIGISQIYEIESATDGVMKVAAKWEHTLSTAASATATSQTKLKQILNNVETSLIFPNVDDTVATLSDITGGGWSATASTVLNYPATGAASFIAVDGITNQLDLSGQDTAETYDFITQNILTTGRTSSGAAYFLRFQENGANVFTLDSSGRFGNNFASINANGPSINNVTASSTVPTLIPRKSVPTNGIGGTATSLDFIHGGVNKMKIEAGGISIITQLTVDYPSNETPLLLAVDIAGSTVKNALTAEIEAEGSGGVGEGGTFSISMIDSGGFVNYGAIVTGASGETSLFFEAMNGTSVEEVARITHLGNMTFGKPTAAATNHTISIAGNSGNGILTISGFGTSGGVQISGTLIGFFGATEIAQPIHIADASGGATVDAEARAAINALLAQQASLGLQASS